MGRVFSNKTTKWFRFKFWLMDLNDVLFSLPNYLNPQPLKSADLSKEELEYFNQYVVGEEFKIDTSTFDVIDPLDSLYPKYICPICEDWFHLPYKNCKCNI